MNPSDVAVDALLSAVQVLMVADHFHESTVEDYLVDFVPLIDQLKAGDYTAVDLDGHLPQAQKTVREALSEPFWYRDRQVMLDLSITFVMGFVYIMADDLSLDLSSLPEDDLRMITSLALVRGIELTDKLIPLN